MSATLGIWSGHLFLWPGRALYVGVAADTELHAHHAIQVCFSIEAPFRLRDPEQGWREYDFASIEADRIHQIDGGGSRLALLYLDPESAEGRTLAAREAGDSFALAGFDGSGALRERLHASARGSADSTAAAEVVNGLLAVITPDRQAQRDLDPRVSRLLAHLRTLPEARLSAAEAAAHVGLSSHRFQHLFRDSTGVPFRRYLLWLRLIAAVEKIASGVSLTAAAHAAAFSDSAHMSRTFRRMFGLAPSSLTKRSEFVQARDG